MPRLTPAQLTTLKTHLAANTNTVIVGGTEFAINSAGLPKRTFGLGSPAALGVKG